MTMVLQVVVALLLLAQCIATTTTTLADSTCYDGDAAIFPYWSYCQCPAMYQYLGGAYTFLLATNTTLGLAPDTLSYVRLSDSPAQYILTHITKDYRFLVEPDQTLLIQNLATGLFLGWATNDDDRLVLIETDDSGSASFRFGFPNSTVDVSLACPRISFARCFAYTLLDSSVDQGISSYEDDDGVAAYLTLSDTAILPFVLIKSQNDTSNCTVSSSSSATSLI